MTDFRELLQPDRGQDARTVALIDKAGFVDWFAAQPAETRALAEANRFDGAADSVLIVSGAQQWSVVAGMRAPDALTPWCLARLAERLPAGTYRIDRELPAHAGLGWMLAQHRFERYKKDEKPAGSRVLLTNDVNAGDATVRQAEAVALVRDMVNTPASDMGPAAIEAEAARIAERAGVALRVTRGDALAQGFPMIHAVGMAADRAYAPRLIEFEWGNPAHPRLAVIGKGVCFDSGGLDIKPASGMRLMKKDMGGAAHALALADLIIAHRLPVRLHLLIPAVENAIAGNAFRPGDVLTSRQGATVEIANTDAEGRLVLADALTKAVEDGAATIIDFATLTGAARVALGPDLPALFGNDDAMAEACVDHGRAVADFVWRMPLHAGYDDMLQSDIADMNNAPEGGFAGAVTAALFLKRFVPDSVRWLHLDTFAWRPAPLPGRPRGGEALGLRAVWSLIRQEFV